MIKKAWNPYGTLLGNSITAIGSADIVLASMTCTADFLHSQKNVFFCNEDSNFRNRVNGVYNFVNSTRHGKEYPEFSS